MKMSGRESEVAPAVEAEKSRKPARDRIFETARDMFYRKGIRAVGVESIAAEAGATKMSLYRNFPSKDELVAEVLREQSRESWEWWDTVTRDVADPREKIVALFEALSCKATDEETYGCALCNAVIEIHEPDHPARMVAQEHNDETHRRFKELARQAGATTDDLGDSLMLVYEGAYMARVTLSSQSPVKNLARTARALLREHLDCPE